MTVRELIQTLQQLEPDQLVLCTEAVGTQLAEYPVKWVTPWRYAAPEGGFHDAYLIVGQA